MSTRAYDHCMHSTSGIRVAELMAAFAVANDFAMGQPVKQAARNTSAYPAVPAKSDLP